MNRRQFTLLTAVSAATATLGDTALAQPSLKSRIETLLDAYVAAWNADDLDAMFRLFAEDAHWINIVGMHWRGRAQVEQAHRAFFEIMFSGVDLRLVEIESIQSLPGGTLIVVSRMAMDAFRQPDGVVEPPSEDRMTLVLVPRGDELAIQHGANIAIVAEAQQHDPVLRSVSDAN